MALSAGSSRPPHDQITELQRKIQLVESDRSAYYERSQAATEKNSDTIRQLRQDNKRLYREQADAEAGDEHIVKTAFHNGGLEKHVYTSGTAAVTTLQQKSLLKEKQLNAQRHTTQTHHSRLEELKVEYQRKKPEGSSSSRALQSDACAWKKERDAMNLRSLENRLEKTQLKCKEAENIMPNYQKFKSHLQDESLTFQGQLDGLEAEILKQREELQSVHLVHKDAQLSKEAAKAELQQLEERLCRERKERERVMASFRRKVEEEKAQAEKAERRVQRTAMQPDELSSEAQRSTNRTAGEEDKVISTFEEAYRHIKESTGVTDVQEIVERFISQNDTHQHLESLKVENEAVLLQLKEQKELLCQQLEDTKYSGEAKVCSDQQSLEEAEHQLQAEQQCCEAGRERLDWLSKTLTTARAGAEHLADKLQHVTASLDTDAEARPDSDESVVELIRQCELKLQALQAELQGTDMAAVLKEMEEEEFLIRIEGNLPEFNTRVKLPEDQTQDLFDDDEESDEDEGDIVSRDALRRQSQLVVDSNSKKKPWKKKTDKY